MSEVLEFVLNGLERALELERELGVRAVEIDRALLGEQQSHPASSSSPVPAPQRSPVTAPQRSPVAAPTPGFSTVVSKPTPPPHTLPQRNAVPTAKPPPPVSGSSKSVVFLHDRPLSPDGATMMAKILEAMKLTADRAPIVVAPPAPAAKIVVVLGAFALRRYFPNLKGEPGQWLKAENGADVLVTYSPEYILRFGTVTPAVQKIKKAMWLSLKTVMQRLAAGTGE